MKAIYRHHPKDSLYGFWDFVPDSLPYLLYIVPMIGNLRIFEALMAEVIGPRVYSCCNCRNNVALHDDIISKAFQVKKWFDGNA